MGMFVALNVGKHCVPMPGIRGGTQNVEKKYCGCVSEYRPITANTICICRHLLEYIL